MPALQSSADAVVRPDTAGRDRALDRPTRWTPARSAGAAQSSRLSSIHARSRGHVRISVSCTSATPRSSTVKRRSTARASITSRLFASLADLGQLRRRHACPAYFRREPRAVGRAAERRLAGRRRGVRRRARPTVRSRRRHHRRRGTRRVSTACLAAAAMSRGARAPRAEARPARLPLRPRRRRSARPRAAAPRGRPSIARRSS